MIIKSMKYSIKVYHRREKPFVQKHGIMFLTLWASKVEGHYLYRESYFKSLHAELKVTNQNKQYSHKKYTITC